MHICKKQLMQKTPGISAQQKKSGNLLFFMRPDYWALTVNNTLPIAVQCINQTSSQPGARPGTGFMKQQNNKNADYYKVVGGYFGAVKIKGRWIRFKNCCYCNLSGLIRWQGPPSKAIDKTMKTQQAIDARQIWPDRIKQFLS